MSDRLDTGDEVDECQRMFCIIDGVVHMWGTLYEPYPPEEIRRGSGGITTEVWIAMDDPYHELSVLQFERAEISERITNLLECMREVEGATDKSTLIGLAAPESQ